VQYTPAAPPSEPQPRSFLTGKVKLAVLGVILVLAFSYVGYLAVKNTADFYSVDELVDNGGAIANRNVLVEGKLVYESFSRGGTTLANFTLQGETHTLPANFRGALPDLFFNPHSTIMLDGHYDPQGYFVAQRVLVKCPSKYRSLDLELPPDYQQPPPSA